MLLIRVVGSGGVLVRIRALQQKGYARPTSKGAPMGSIRPPNGEGELTIDFKSTQAIRTLALKDQLDFGAVVLVRCISSGYFSADRGLLGPLPPGNGGDT